MSDIGRAEAPPPISNARRQIPATVAERAGYRRDSGRSRSGKRAEAWYRYALKLKGGKECPYDLREKIEAGTFALWRALELRAFIVADQRTRGNLLNMRTRTLPGVNESYDTAFEQWKRINDELELDKAKAPSLADLRQELAAKRSNGSEQGKP
jgi:hypothetical protein